MYLLDGMSGRHRDCYLVPATGQISGTEVSLVHAFKPRPTQSLDYNPDRVHARPPWSPILADCDRCLLCSDPSRRDVVRFPYAIPIIETPSRHELTPEPHIPNESKPTERPREGPTICLINDQGKGFPPRLHVA